MSKKFLLCAVLLCSATTIAMETQDSSTENMTVEVLRERQQPDDNSSIFQRLFNLTTKIDPYEEELPYFVHSALIELAAIIMTHYND